MSELLPCPFCGEDEPESLTITRKVRQPIIAAQVNCLNCGARGPTHYDGEGQKSADNGASWVWNNERADHVNELVAAAYADAFYHVESSSLGWKETRDALAVKVPTDATAALAARDARVREAALREAREEADQIAKTKPPYAPDQYERGYAAGAENVASAIAILIAKDATAALAARDARVREAALKEAAEVCKTASDKAARGGLGNFTAHDQDASNILALIEKDTTNG